MEKLILIISFCFVASHTKAQLIYTNVKSPDLKFNIWINNPNGEEVLEGKGIILEFWATWCGSCVAAIPHINKLADKYHTDITFVSVNSYEGKKKVESFLQKKNMTSLVALDTSQYLKTIFEVQVIPVTFLIDKKGNLRWKGFANNLTEELIDTFLAKDTILDSFKETVLIDEKFSKTFLKNDTLKTSAFNIYLEKLVQDNFQETVTSISTDFKQRCFFETKNFGIPNLLRSLIGTWHEEEVDISFKGNVPNHFSVNFSASSDSLLTKGLFFEELISQLGVRLKFNIDTLQTLEKTWLIIDNSEKLQPYLSLDQSKRMGYHENEITEYYSNITLKQLASIINSVGGAKIKYRGDDSQFYDFDVLKTKNLIELQTFLKDKYAIEFVVKEVVGEKYKIIFN